VCSHINVRVLWWWDSIIRVPSQTQEPGESLGNLILIAPPRFLGMLRKELSSPLDQLVTSTIDKDLTTASVDDIIDHIKS